jgi:hypothetical protein
MEFDLCCFPDDVMHASAYFGQDIGVLHLDVMTQVCAVFSHGSLIGIVETDMLVLLSDHGLNGTLGLSNVHYPKLAENAVYAWCFSGPEEARQLPWREAHCLDVVFGQHPNNETEGGADKGQKLT